MSTSTGFGSAKKSSFGSPNAYVPPLSPTKTTLPTAGEIVKRLKTTHPRLLASNADFTELKKQIQVQVELKRWYELLHRRAQAMLREPVSTYRIPDGLRLLSTSKVVQERVYTLAMVYRLEQDPRFANRAWQELYAASRFPDWNPRHFLDVAEMTHAFAIGYDWLFDVWTPQQKDVLREAIITKGLKPALSCYKGESPQAIKWWVDNTANWNQVCNGGIGLGALAVADQSPSIAGEVLHSILWSLPPSLHQLGPDGGSAEGPSYWDYGMSYVVVLLAAMDSALGSDFGLSQIPGLEKAGYFPLYMKGPTNLAFNFSDGSEAAPGMPALFWLSHRFRNPHFAVPRLQYLDQGNPWVSPLDLLWGRKASDNPPETLLPVGAYFRGTEVVTFRTSWDDPEALFVGFRAGDNQASHAHLDLGSFVFDALGQRWAIDLGRENYNLPGYFGSQRTDYYRVRAEGHNTLVLNPSDQADQSPATARITKFNATVSGGAAIADLTPAYQKQARSVQRGIALQGHFGLLIQDEINAAQTLDAWWFMHTRAQILLSQNQATALLSQGGKQMQAQIISPAGASFTILQAEPLSDSPRPERQNLNTGIRKLAIHLPNLTKERIVVMLAPVNTPVQNLSALPQLQPNIRPLMDW